VKRSPELAALSRDHHQALEVVLRLRRASGETLEAAVVHFLEFWTRQGEQHFAIEERLVLPALPDDDADWTEATRRVRAEHRKIQAGAASLADAPSVRAARGVGELLTAHVRFEERTLFPLVEQRLSRAALAELGRALAAAT
jgi:Hemerythrin HHE cation binding domain